MNKSFKYGIVMALMGPFLLANEGCEPNSKDTKHTQADKAAQAANSITFTDNAEIDNIKARLELTANPGLLGFIILLNESGAPVLYEGVKGKITSGEKRLTKPYEFKWWNNVAMNVVSPSDEGTYGQSAHYIFYWNTQGQYRQWNGKYLYSDKPFRLTVEPIVVNVENKK